MNKHFLISIFAIVIIAWACSSGSHDLDYKKDSPASTSDKSVAAEMEEESSISESSFKKDKAKDEEGKNTPEDDPSLAKTVALNSKTPADRKIIKEVLLKFKVKNVVNTTENIEDLTSKYNGFVTYSELENKISNYDYTDFRLDSVLVSKEFIVQNRMRVRIPADNLGTFIRELNQYILFLDTRTFNYKDITIEYKANQKKAERLAEYNKRQMVHIDTKPSKLYETTNAEENRLRHQMNEDAAIFKNLELEDKLEYSEVNITIYQKAVHTREVFSRPGFFSNKPNFFIRAWDSIVLGFKFLQEVILFFLKLWGIILLAYVSYVLIRMLVSKMQKKKNKNE